MDYKKALETINQSQAQPDLDVIINTRDYEEIRTIIDANRDGSKNIKSESLSDDKQQVLNILQDHEGTLKDLIDDLKNKFYFQGLLSDFNPVDVFDCLLRSSSIEYIEEEGAQVSDEEPFM